LPTHMMLFAFVGTVFAQHFYATNPAASFKHMFAGLLCPRSGLFVSFIPHLVSECSWLFCLNKSANLFYIFSSKSTYIFLVNQPRKLMGYRNQGVSWGFSHHFFSVTATSQDRPGLAIGIAAPWRDRYHQVPMGNHVFSNGNPLQQVNNMIFQYIPYGNHPKW
jgi:hypothetical protein